MVYFLADGNGTQEDRTITNESPAVILKHGKVTEK